MKIDKQGRRPNFLGGWGETDLKKGSILKKFSKNKKKKALFKSLLHNI